MKHRLWKIALLVAVLLGMPIALFVFHFRPLIPSRVWSAFYIEESALQQPAEVYTMLFRPARVFIHLPEGRTQRYQWLALDLEKQLVAVPNWPHLKPYLHFNDDMALGITLDFPKIEDDWKINWKDDQVSFSNGNLSVHLVHK